MDAAKELFDLLERKDCDYDACRHLIREIGGCTKIVEDQYGLKTTPLHESIRFGHYDFALDLIGEEGADLDVAPEGWGPVMWDLQFLDAETEEEQWAESASKLRIMRALIHAGANPNPIGDDGNETLLECMRFEVNEWACNTPVNVHHWQMEHIIEAHAYGETNRFFAKLSEQGVSQILLADWGFWLLDDNLCDSDYAIFLFADGECMRLSSYQTDDDEWDFYAVPLLEDWTLDKAKHHEILPSQGLIQLVSRYSDAVCPNSHWLDLSIDDGILHIHADEPNITVAIGCCDGDDYERLKRKKLFYTTDQHE